MLSGFWDLSIILDNPKPDAKFWLPVSRAHVRACSKVHKVSMRKGYIPGRKGAKITYLPLAPTRPWTQMKDANHPGSPRRTQYKFSWELVSSRFARCPILFKTLRAKESNNVEFIGLIFYCNWKLLFLEDLFSGTSSSSNTDRSEESKIGLMRSYGFLQLQYDLCATFFLSQLENVNAVEVNRRETLFVTESCSSGKIRFWIFQDCKQHGSE